MNENKTPKEFLDLLNVLKTADKSEESQFEVQKLVERYLPYWFIPMLNDEHRNNFYFKLIKNYVAGKTVLEIGAGIGLMSIHAAKSGAKHVYACELNPLLFHLAQENIEKSGYAKKITLFLKHSDDLVIGKDIPKKVDIILSELISDNLFSEDMFSSLKNAHSLLKKDGLFLPDKISMKGCLITVKEDFNSDLHRQDGIYKELSVLSQKRSLRVNLSRMKYDFISDPVDVFNVQNGYEINPHFPIDFSIKKNLKKKHKNVYFCIFFELKDGRNKLTNLDVKDKNVHSHWGQVIWKLEDNKEVYHLRLIEKEEYLFLVERKN